MNILTGILIGAVGLGVWGLSRLAIAGTNIVTEIKARIFSIDLTSLVVGIDVNIKNPSQGRAVVSYPFIKISYKDNVIASSELLNKKFVIEPMSQTKINNIKLPIHYLSLGNMATEVIEKIKNKKHLITLQVTVQTDVILLGQHIPYSHTQNISI
jgi:hypothetical protein